MALMNNPPAFLRHNLELIGSQFKTVRQRGAVSDLLISDDEVYQLYAKHVSPIPYVSAR